MTNKRLSETQAKQGRRVDASRRKFLIGAAAAGAAASWPLILTPGKARAAETLYIASYGGQYEEWLRKIFWDPFTADTGIKVVATAAMDMAKLKAGVTTGNVEWDVVEALPTQVVTAAREGLLEKMDYSIIQMDDLIYPEAKADYWLSAYSYTASIGYDAKRTPEGKYPATWVDFWDVKKYPGRRGLRPRPNDTLEIALLADGVAPKSVYPLDVERAFKSMDKIKPYVNIWIDSTPQTVQLIAKNELDFTNTYSGRVFAAQAEGLPLGYAQKQMLIFLNTYAVPKGAKNKAAAMKLLNYHVKSDLLAKFCDVMTYAPVKKRGMEMVKPEIRRDWVPDPANPNHLVVNPQWWGEPGRFDELTKRFKAWQLT